MKPSLKVYHWTPRILGIAAILFISIFSLDAFDPKLQWWEQAWHFIMHLIPSLILLCVLLIAWKWEKIGGYTFILLGLTLSPIVYSMNYKMNESVWMSLGVIAMITVPFIIAGILFMLSYYQKKKLHERS